MAENFDDSFFLSRADENRRITGEAVVNEIEMAAAENDQTTTNKSKRDVVIVDTAESVPYKPLDFHWFYTRTIQDKANWMPMSFNDSNRLESVYLENKDLLNRLQSASVSERKKILTDESRFLLSTKGGRFECDLVDLVRRPVYWKEKYLEKIRRCLWFYKENNEQKFVPYEEEYSEFLEKEYERTIKNNLFHKRIDFKPIGKPSFSEEKTEAAADNEEADTEAFVFHSTSLMQHFQQASMLDEFGNLSSDAKRPRIMKRGIQEVTDKIESDEIDEVDELCFVVHGIGDGCDIRFRSIVECVDDFREMSSIIIQAHFKNLIDAKKINGRVEFIPIYWHGELHGSETTGIDDRLTLITLPSIPKLRQYSNSTILDVLFYTSPIYCQTIISKVANEINRLYDKFMQRNPNFKGNISMVGHSLGSLIIFDLLSHQHDGKTGGQTELKSNLKSAEKSYESLDEFLVALKLSNYKDLFEKENITLDSLTLLKESDLIQLGLPIGPRRILQEALNSDAFRKERLEVEKKIIQGLRSIESTNGMNPLDTKSVNYCKYGLAGTGQLLIKYPQLNFKIKSFFALGSPISVILTVRGVEKLGKDFRFPTCESFFNIFHPFDPVAYRLEPLISSENMLPPVLLPHHKGRKRLHLELKEGFTKVSEDFKQKMYDQFNKAWTSIADLAKLPLVASNLNNPSIASSTVVTAVTAVQEQQSHSQSSKTSQPEIVDTELMSTTDEEVGVHSKQNLTLNSTACTSKDEEAIDLGKINKGRRVDYVLQESPIESFNEYLFALASHACYWESEDTMLLLMKEIYNQSIMESRESKLNDEAAQFEQTNQQISWLDSNIKKTFSFLN